MIYRTVVLFFCGLLLRLVTSDTEKMCRVRELTVRRETWNQWAGFYCYLYTNDYRLKFKYDEIKIISNIPVAIINGTYFWYDFQNSTSLDYVNASFKTKDYFNLWMNCCQEAVDCCDNFMNDENIYGTEKYPCPAVWDGWSCFGAAKAGTIEKLPCSHQAYSSDSPVCELTSEKECFQNGTWNQQTNYEVCDIVPVLRNRHNFHVIFLAAATFFCFPSVVIFSAFRRLRSKVQFNLHRNLILIVIIRSILTIVSKELIILDALKTTGSNHVIDENGVACRVLAFFESAAKNGMYACMLVDGFYLHKLIVRPFADDPRSWYMYGTALVLSFLPSLIWATKRSLAHGDKCWMIDTTEDEWIVDAFRIVILAINSILLVDIIRVMILKLKGGNITRQAKTTFKATLFLIPLFGVTIFIITDRNLISGNTCTEQNVYSYGSYTVEALQGVMIALLFCYANLEVYGELKNAVRKLVLWVQAKFNIDLKQNNDIKRKNTVSTCVRNSIDYT